MKFIKKLFISTITTIISFIIIVFVIVGLAAISFSDSGSEISEIQNNSILKINLNSSITDRGSSNDIDISNIINQSQQNLGLNEILSSIEKAKNDDRIKGIYLNIENPNASIATIEEIRNKLQEFKDSTDKFIVSYSEIYSQSAYLISSVAHQIYMHPEGILELKGLAYQGMFFKNALEKLDVEAQIIRHGKFKSAVEPFMLDKMSESNRVQTRGFLTSIWEDIKDEITEDRPLDVQEVNLIAENFLIQKANDAVKYKLIDKLMYKDELIDSLKSKLNITDSQDLNVVSLGNYKNAKLEGKKYSKNKIAVIYATGEISGGEGDNQSIGSEGLSKAIRKARKDDKIKAIVLRVNSPGGSALASETILREMALAKKEKTTVVSMGDVAASGGYYIACQADTIVANPTTITGSIGVFGVLFNAQNMMNNTLGINVDTVKTNSFADLGTPFRPLTTVERNIIQNSVENIYDTFISRVADGRNMTKNQVDEIGQGRVWSGRDALELGLVDVLGGLEKSIELAAEMAKLNDYRIVNLPKEKDPFQEILDEVMNGQIRNSILKKELGQFYPQFKEIQELRKMDDIQMRMPVHYQIK
ncbi:MAG: signal peptide peptidase SppA [Flavobacteriales bacterium]